jgi:transcriptional antiterminator RfaH
MSTILLPDHYEPAWYCVRSQPKHEHIAAANLRRGANIDVFSPRLRIRRALPHGPIWVSEALFPGYFFAFFNLATGLDQVRYTSGVKHVVHFGGRCPAIAREVIEELRARAGENEVVEHITEFLPGDELEIVQGPFHGLTVVVQRHMPAAQRVRVLLDLLGRPTAVELHTSQVRGGRQYPAGFLAEETARTVGQWEGSNRPEWRTHASPSLPLAAGA